MSKTAFEIVTIGPGGSTCVEQVRAAVQAGATGLFDLEWSGSDDAAVAAIAADWSALLASLPGRATGTAGFRVQGLQHALIDALLRASPDRALCVVVAGTPEVLQDFAKRHAKPPRQRWLAEVTSAERLEHIPTIFDGLVARGHEAGGWVGEDTSYILLQKLLKKTTRPVWVQGGIGVRTVAACHAAGAAGVVLDDALLLLAESPLTAPQQQELARLNGVEAKLLGELAGQPLRVYARPGSAALKAAEELGREADTGTLAVHEWAARMSSRCGWAADGSQLLPIGQAIGFAAHYRREYGSVARVIQAVRKASAQQVEQALRLATLDEGSAMALSHGTRFALAQGPMTRVSDSPAFAAEVAKAGALPFLALALTRGPQVLEMLKATKALIDAAGSQQPWGVGMLGFVPQALRQEQCEAIWQCKPPFALIAGGRPDQAAEFEQRGIATYIHAPAPALLKLYLEQGARRFVFEGRECGGHVGPLASFPLWEQMIEVLLEHTPAGADKQIHVLFAGGIHDARSAAMVAAMAAPLSVRGMKVGCLMGTAYLFTREIVSSGAIIEGFQAEAIACQRTINLESGPGHATRCVVTQFATDFLAERRRLVQAGKSSEEIRDALEDLNVGRLRIASKGVNRGEDGKVVAVSAEQQRVEGMYMIGQVATLRDGAVGIDALHREVSHGAQALLAARVAPAAKAGEQPSDIAIIGVGVVLPKANDANEYWRNILGKVSVIRETPETRWDWKLYFDENPKQRDKVYSKWGGFLDEISFDPTRFGIPPRSMKSIDPLQILTLEAASRALADAGYSEGGYDRENTSIVLGAGGGAGDLGMQYAMRAELPRFVENLSEDVWSRLPEWTEESFAGTLLNVAAGRVANRMDFGGINFTIDAACASSLAAISVAVNELESGRSNVALAGGFDTTQSAYAFMAFAKTSALSPTGKPKSFDQAADGIAISEGVSMVVLKRLADAERDGDRIYGVIKSVSGSSDGRALGLTAPRSEGQVRALDRAYAKAGFSPATLGLVEAHGTGTSVGDRAEALTICRALSEGGAAPRSVALGSVKTLLGHTKAAAGVSGMIKVALALHRRTLPAHVGVDNPIEPIADPASPVMLLKEPRAWLAHPQHPRRGGASAFGFGGTNFHVVLEEYRGQSAPVGADAWPQELCLFRAATPALLIQRLEALLPALRTASRLNLAELAFALARDAEAAHAQPVTAAIIASHGAALAADIEALLVQLHGGIKPLPAHIRYQPNTPAAAGELAFLFPGQGAQHLNMGRETALYFDELREALELADRTLASDYPQLLSSYVMPAAAFDDATESAQAQALTDTRVAQPAIGALALGYLKLARRLGLHATAAAGHSYGEYAALLAGDVISAEDFIQLSAVRGQAMALAASTGVPGGMAAVQGKRSEITALIAGAAGVIIANHNTPEQSVISGPRAAVEQAVARITQAGLKATLLPVSGAFHTELVAPAKTALSAAIHRTRFAPASLQVFSNSSAEPYPAEPSAMQAHLDAHLLSRVEFVAEIEALHAAGCRVFVELGPKSICTNMARQTLAGKPALAVSLDGSGGGLRGLLLNLAELYIAGIAWRPAALFARRDLPLVEVAKALERGQPRVLPRHTWMISGGCARPLDDAEIRTGIKPALTAATREQAAIAQITALTPPPQIVTHTVVQPATVAAAPIAGSAPVPTISSGVGSDALLAYQQTMRQFLSLQERVVQQFMSGAAPAALPNAPALPAVTARPAPSAAAASIPPTVAAPVPAAMAPAPAASVLPLPPPPATAPLAPVASAAVALMPDLSALLLGIVAERTGYPTDMLGVDADLEADLGIDSIKRVEILGALRKALPAALGETMQSGMERFTKAKTLNALLEQMTALASALPRAAAAPVPLAAPIATAAAAATLAMAATATAVDLKALLLEIVAERTGYPTDMLGLEADLEADLGIDSIKRVEILGALRKALPSTGSDAMQARMEQFTKAKSLAAILTALEGLQPLAAASGTVVTVSERVTTTTTVTVSGASASSAPAAVDVQALLLGIVAERTGYPTDMLGMEADLEADLGIDSIKRVEILGALRKALPPLMAERMQAEMERFAKAKSLAAILAAVAAVQPVVAAAAPVSAVTPVAAVAAVATPQVAVDVQSLLLDIIAERTGYPTDMLGLDADLEADLGIDSIKRVEIIGALRKALPAALGEALQAGMEKFTKARSLAAMIDQLAALQQGPAVAPPAAKPVVAPLAAAVQHDAPLARYIVQPRPMPLPSAIRPLRGLAILLGERGELADDLGEQLQASGLVPVVVSASDRAGIDAAFARARQAHGPIVAMLHLHGLRQATVTSLADWRAAYQRDVIGFFHAVQALGSELGVAPIIAASRLGGRFGRDGIGTGPATAGGANGVFNCLRYEYPEARLRAVDFEAQSDAEIALRLTQELLADDTAFEAGYVGSTRYGSVTAAQSLRPRPEAAAVAPARHWIVLATGGARGITAGILERLARPGLRLVLLGRTAAPGPEPAETAGHTDAAALKKAVLQHKLAQGEKPKPVEIDREVNRLLVDREIRHNLSRLAATGAIVDYRACDVRNEASFGGLIDALYAEHGRIDAVLHAAGVIEDKLITDKTAESFERVLGTKLDAAFVLARKLNPESLRSLTLFGSVAGRYGNRGQSDYAAGNEILNRMAWQLAHQWPNVRVQAINWGPWDAGMASEGVKTALRARGMEPISLADGCRFFIDELAYAAPGQVEVVAGVGPWHDPAVILADYDPTAATFVTRLAAGSRLTEAPRVGAGGAVVADAQFDPAMDGLEVSALTSQLMAEFVALAWPGWQLRELVDLRIEGLGDTRGRVQLRARAATHSEPGLQSATVELLAAGSKKALARATAVLVPALAAEAITESAVKPRARQSKAA